MSILPKDYKEPDTSNYMRLKQGENRFRVLSEAIVGMEYWKDDGENRKPVRKQSGEKIDMSDLETDPKTGELKMPKHFWAFVVWNYQSEKVQILELTQATIRRKLIALDSNKKWGDFREYDITITKEGEGFDTTYETMPDPKSKIDGGIVQMAKDMHINLKALFTGEDPFTSEVKVDVDEVAKSLGVK